MERVNLHYRGNKMKESDQHEQEEKVLFPEKRKGIKAQSRAPGRHIITVWSLGMTSLAILTILPEDRNAATSTILCVIPLIGLLLTLAIRTLQSTIACTALATIVNILLLFFVRSCKELSQMTGRPIDVDAFRIVLAPPDIVLGALGESAVNKFQAVVFEEAIWCIIYVCSTLVIAYLLHGCSPRILKDRVEKLTRILRLGLEVLIAVFLLMESVHFLKDELYIHPSTSTTLRGATTTCADIHVPPLHIKDRKNVVFIIMESLRADFFNRHTFEETFAVLDDLRNGDGLGAKCTEWKNHDSESMQTDYAHSGLLHGFTPSHTEQIVEYVRNPNIQSWPLTSFRNNGYKIRRVTQVPPYDAGRMFEYCFSVQKFCDLYTRDFPTEIDYQTGLGATFDKSLELLRNASKHGDNLFLVTDIQQAHNPYYFSEAKFHPTCTQDEMWDLYEKRWDVGPTELEDIQRKIQNRYANSLAHIDKYLATFLSELTPNLGSDTLLVFVGDHGELLLDDIDRNLGHVINTFEDMQRHVPMMWCGGAAQVAGLNLPDSHVSTHVDIMPTLLEALGADFDDAWKSNMPGQSYYNYKTPLQSTSALDGGFALFTGSSDDKRVARTSKLRIEMYGDDFSSVGINGYNASTSDVQQVLEKISRRRSQNWPGKMCGHNEVKDFVSCGSYYAKSCMECPQRGHYFVWCTDDCRFDQRKRKCVRRMVPLKLRKINSTMVLAGLSQL
mmetsp:Transcript_36191/g.108385  ORF Transcript_36191/g.108385 Transcript_36191/m.108385 type:complete len:727 (-) Transcript_36191:218-2398(-)